MGLPSSRRPAKWSLADVDGLVRLRLRRHGKAVRGHTLLWHRSTPAWVEQRLREQRDWRLISPALRLGDPALWGRHQPSGTSSTSRSKPAIAWDGLRRNVFLEAFGPDYIRRALVEARALAPRARLMLNEYSLEYDSREERDRRYLFLKLVEGLKRSGAPLDGIGLAGPPRPAQGHGRDVIDRQRS